jgi:hypothetical protein
MRHDEGATLTEALIVLVIFAVIGTLLNDMISHIATDPLRIHRTHSPGSVVSDSGHESLTVSLIELYRLDTLFRQMGDRIRVPFFATDYVDSDPGSPGSASVSYLDGESAETVRIESDGHGTTIHAGADRREWFPSAKNGRIEKIVDPAGICSGLTLRYRLPEIGGVAVRLLFAGVPLPRVR